MIRLSGLNLSGLANFPINQIAELTPSSESIQRIDALTPYDWISRLILLKRRRLSCGGQLRTQAARYSGDYRLIRIDERRKMNGHFGDNFQHRSIPSS